MMNAAPLPDSAPIFAMVCARVLSPAMRAVCSLAILAVAVPSCVAIPEKRVPMVSVGLIFTVAVFSMNDTLSASAAPILAMTAAIAASPSMRCCVSVEISVMMLFASPLICSSRAMSACISVIDVLIVPMLVLIPATDELSERICALRLPI